MPRIETTRLKKNQASIPDDRRPLPENAPKRTSLDAYAATGSPRRSGATDGWGLDGSTGRPAFRRLLADIEKGEIDQVVFRKMDRQRPSHLGFIGVKGFSTSAESALIR